MDKGFTTEQLESFLKYFNEGYSPELSMKLAGILSSNERNAFRHTSVFQSVKHIMTERHKRKNDSIVTQYMRSKGFYENKG